MPTRKHKNNSANKVKCGLLRGCPSLVGGRPANTTNNIDQIDWLQFKTWVCNKYANSWAVSVYCYAKKYSYLLNDLGNIDNLPSTIRNNVTKSLIILSKFLGVNQQFKQRLLDYGIKIRRQDSFTSFLRILNANDNGNDILEWFKEAQSKLRNNEKTLLKFLLYSGLRKEEAITSFNLIIELHRNKRLNDYYDDNLSCLRHFKYPRDFIRRTKNCFISFIPEELLKRIQNSEPVSYDAMSRRLYRNNMKCRFNELRDFYGTYLLQHGILEPEINLLQGRIPPSIFIKHYWSPKLSELRDRILKALENLEQTIK